ncbi:MAG TPA: hypothetical protein PKC39_03860 [Ferruginibacter sp.]|nr:hypothetical protein [Ferruginibacter sp.]HMP20075.1 hypothetical protein [Ferruginibacter sp.]
MVKLLHYTGLAACIVLIVSCFMPWAYYADIEQEFTGFYSYQNQYGKPGKFLVFIAVLVFVFMLLHKVWARRTNLFLAALAVGYAIKSFVLFTSCYNAYCPQKKAGIYMMLIATLWMMLAAVFPHLKLDNKTKTST